MSFFGHSLILFSFLLHSHAGCCSLEICHPGRSSLRLYHPETLVCSSILDKPIGSGGEARLKRTYHLLLKIIEHPMNICCAEAISNTHLGFLEFHSISACIPMERLDETTTVTRGRHSQFPCSETCEYGTNTHFLSIP